MEHRSLDPVWMGRAAFFKSNISTARTLANTAFLPTDGSDMCTLQKDIAVLDTLLQEVRSLRLTTAHPFCTFQAYQKILLSS